MKLTRRHFLAWAGLGALGAVACEGFGIREGELNIQSPVSLPEDLVRGKDNWYATLCRNCPASQGILVRVMEGRAKKIQGNPLYPTNQGKTHAPCEAGVQALYHPDRIPGPMKRAGNRGSGQFDPIAWEPEAMDTLTRQLNDRGAYAAIITKPTRGHLGMLTQRFAQATGIQHLKFEAADNNPYRNAVKNVYQQDVLPDFDIENANFILSFGADFLSTWLSPTRFNRGYGEFRQGQHRHSPEGANPRGTLYHVDSRFSMTAANADKWIPVRPGWEGYLALSIAQVIVEKELQAPGLDLDALLGPSPDEQQAAKQILNAFRPEAVAPLVGITPEIAASLSGTNDGPVHFIEKLAEDFATHGPSIAIAGGSAGAHSNGLFNLEAAAVLNWLVGSVGAPGGVTLNPNSPWPSFHGEMVPASDSASPIDDFEQLAQRIRSGDIRMLLLHNVDPVHGLPGSLRLRDAIESAQDLYIVSFSPFIDDTSALADLLLPDRVYLEDWGDDIPDPAPGHQTAGFQQPVVNPLWDLDPRSFPDVLLAAADGLGFGDQLPWPSYQAMLKEAATALFEENRGSIQAATADEFWTTLLRRGLWQDESATGPSRQNGNPTPRAGLLRHIAQSASQPAFAGFGGPDTVHLAPFSHNTIHGGELAHLPWLQAAPDPVTSITWQTWIEMNDATAQRFGIRQGDIVRVESSQGSIRAVAYLTPATPPGVVAIPFGGGRRHGSDYATHLSWGALNDQIGRPGPESSNVNEILEPTRVAGPGSHAWAATRVRISPTGQSVMLSKMEGTTQPGQHVREVGLSPAEEIIKTIQPGNY